MLAAMRNHIEALTCLLCIVEVRLLVKIIGAFVFIRFMDVRVHNAREPTARKSICVRQNTLTPFTGCLRSGILGSIWAATLTKRHVKATQRSCWPQRHATPKLSSFCSTTGFDV